MAADPEKAAAAAAAPLKSFKTRPSPSSSSSSSSSSSTSSTHHMLTTTQHRAILNHRRSLPRPLLVALAMASSALILFSLLALAPHRQHSFSVLASPLSSSSSSHSPSLPPSSSSTPTTSRCLVEQNCYLGRHSAYSFDADSSSRATWMAALPDAASLASLSIPGTHDTMTYAMPDPRDARTLQCQNLPLRAQLRAGLRYFDVRARLRAGQLRIYHADGDTGFGLDDVLGDMFAFLDENPSEALVVRLKQEGPPVRTGAAADDASSAANNNNNNTNSSSSSSSFAGSPPANVTSFDFEDAFNAYRLSNPSTSPGAKRHLYMYDPSRDGPIPTLGQLRSKILLLQNFPSRRGPSTYGIAWEGEQMALQDAWIVPDIYHLADKWVAIREGLTAAATITTTTTTNTTETSKDTRLHLGHVSASVGVLPIDAAAGPLNHSITGLNDMTAQWLLDYRGVQGLQPRVGIVIFDFPGRRAVDAVLAWNKPQPDLQ